MRTEPGPIYKTLEIIRRKKSRININVKTTSIIKLNMKQIKF